MEIKSCLFCKYLEYDEPTCGGEGDDWACFHCPHMEGELWQKSIFDLEPSSVRKWMSYANKCPKYEPAID